MKSKQAGNHQFHYLTGKHEMFSVSVAAKFSTHAKIKYTELYLIDTLFRPNVCEKIASFCQKMHTKENWFFFCLIV